MNIKKDPGIDNIFKYIDLQENDVILYLGGRIDDDNLYPPRYRKYLKAKIKRLKPTKIICHNHWYAKKYYEKGILTKHTKIDMTLAHYGHVSAGNFLSINREDYSDHHTWMKILIDKNPNIVCAMYISQGKKPSSVDVNDGWFREDYDLNNVKYFSFDRTYSPKDLTEEDLGHGGGTRNASDGFAVITSLVKAGFKNLNILGFSAFGSDEDQSYHTAFGPGRFAGRKYFNLGTSEDQLAEADILQSWVQTKKIKNVEDYSKLMLHLKDNKMQSTIKDLFDKIQNAEVQTEPFDHLVVDNLLPDDFFKELAKELEAEDFPNNYARGPYGKKERFGVDITDYSTWKASGHKIPTTIHQGNYNSLLSRKSTHLEFFINFLLKNEKDFYSLLGSKLPTERLQDNYFFHVSMIKDSVGYEVKTHCDNEQNIFTIIFYAPETDVNKEFGLDVYKDGRDIIGRRVKIGSCHPGGSKYLESGGRIDFMPNRMIIFAASYPNRERRPTWHEVRRLSDKLVGTRNSFQMFFLKSHSK